MCMNAEKNFHSRCVLERNKLALSEEFNFSIIYGKSTCSFPLYLQFIRKDSFFCLGYVYQGKLTMIALLD